MLGKRIAVAIRVLPRVLLPALVACTLAPRAGAVTLRANSSTVSAPGDQAQICVALETEGKTVAGTQNDLEWDTSCASLPNKASCVVNAQHGKQLQSAMPKGDGVPPLRALVLSLSDVKPIADSELYCCTFSAKMKEPGCCDIKVTRVGASTPDGKALDTKGVGGQLCYGEEPAAAGEPAAPGEPAVAGEPAAAAKPAAAAEAGGGGGGWFGCQVAPGASGLSPLLQIVITGFAFALLRRRRT
jgi:hypothetical protein